MEKNLGKKQKYTYTHARAHTHTHIYTYISESLSFTPETQYCKSTLIGKKTQNFALIELLSQWGGEY